MSARNIFERYKKRSDTDEKKKPEGSAEGTYAESVKADLNDKKPPEVEWKPETQNIVKKAKTDKTLDDKKFLSQKKKKEAAVFFGLSLDEVRKILNVLSSKNRDSY